MTATLLAVRLPPTMVAELRRCPGLAEMFKVVSVGQHQDDDVRDWVDEHAPQQRLDTFNLYAELSRSCGVTHAIVSQPLHWYSDVAALAFRMKSVRVFWLEQYFDRVLLDEVGCQYTADNEFLRHESGMPILPVQPRETTRHEQPERQTASDLWQRYGRPAKTVVIYGQTPGDMAMVDTSGGMTYERWLEALIQENPRVQFIFKSHPLAMASTVPVGADGVRLTTVDAHVHSLFDTYPFGASYSSTCILEGISRGVKFVTGGHHFMSGLTYRITHRAGARDILGWLNSFKPDDEDIASRLSFIENRYTMKLDDPVTLQRLLCEDVREFYRSRGTQ